MILTFILVLAKNIKLQLLQELVPRNNKEIENNKILLHQVIKRIKKNKIHRLLVIKRKQERTIKMNKMINEW
jgi:hypothetical protein